MTEPSPKYGLTRRTRKPVTRACNDLSQAITALDRHHAEEAEGFEANLRAAMEAAEGNEAAARAIEVIRQAATRLRLYREEALAPMLEFRPDVVDALLEAEGILPEGAGKNLNVERYDAAPLPRPAGGMALDVANWVRVLGETYQWSCEATLGNAALALGPAYLLGCVLEHPTPEASKLRADAQAVHDQARRLVHRASRD